MPVCRGSRAFCRASLVLVLLSCAQTAQSAVLNAVVDVSPSEYWEGNDGPWSSFAVQIGSPPQSVRLLPSTSGSSTWVVLPEGCTPSDPPACPVSRGFLFNRNSSHTWSSQDFHKLPLQTQSLLGYSGDVYFGFDNITFGWPGSGGQSVKDPQVVVGLAANDFYVGQIGLSARPVNFTDLSPPKKSLLASLRQQGSIGGSSWGYTAGAAYKPTKVFGSLTFGGYDEARFVKNNLTFTFGADSSRDILVGMRDITAIGNGNNMSTSLLESPITVVIDSTDPFLWLPSAACQRFERYLGISFNETEGLYILNNTFHGALMARNETFRFTIGQGVQGGGVLDIVVPYAAFDLQFVVPETGETLRYFPLKMAQNDSMYTIGRAFLQEAYLFTDYDRNTFTVSQALFPDTSDPKELTPVFAPSNTKARITAGVTAAALVALLVLVLISFFAYRRYKRKRDPEISIGTTEPSPENREKGRQYEVDGRGVTTELGGDSNAQRWELLGTTVYEMVGTDVQPQELQGIVAARRDVKVAR